MARPKGALRRNAAKLASDPNNLPAVLGPAGVVYKLACGSDKYTP